MNTKDRGGTVLYTDIKWEHVRNLIPIEDEWQGIMHYGYGKDVVTLNMSKVIMFRPNPILVASVPNEVELNKHNAESQIAQVITEYVEEMGATTAKLIHKNYKLGDSLMIGNPYKELKYE